MGKIIYHIVPKYIYERSINRLGNYNCKGFEDSNYIHTTAGLRELKKAADLFFTNEMKGENQKLAGLFYEKPSVEFLLLVIDRSKVTAKIGFVKPAYYHIYGSIPRKAYKIKKVKRDSKGRFLI